jgi:hypothetical protein
MRRMTWKEVDRFRFAQTCWGFWFLLMLVTFLWCCPAARFPLPDRVEGLFGYLEELPPALER